MSLFKHWFFTTASIVVYTMHVILIIHKKNLAVVKNLFKTLFIQAHC